MFYLKYLKIIPPMD